MNVRVSQHRRVPWAQRLEFSPSAAVIAASVSVLVIGAVDYVTGVELRVYPLYYVPVSIIAWNLARRWTVAFAILAALTWYVANQIAGLHYSHDAIWVANIAMQTGSFVVVGLLIAEVRKAHRTERALGRTDTLTDLPNRRAFFEEAPRLLALARRQRNPVTVAFVDLDNFKHLNDTQGHDAGDEALRRVAAVLRSNVRAGDLAARLGGDEFVVLLPDAGEEAARVLLERIRTRLAEALTDLGGSTTASVGGATYAEPPTNLDGVIQKADELMYGAKSAGKNAVALHTVTGPSEGA
ncbi:MAG: GGDEF domain-containing protein [Polyangiales bacterium]